MKRIMVLWLAVLLLLTGCAQASDTPGQAWYTDAAVSVDEQQLQSIFATEFTPANNVILMIADGMGPNDMILAQQYVPECFDFGLVMNQIPCHGLATTHSADNKITDSAAAATALATGEKTDNGRIGMSSELSCLTNLCEIARQEGKKIGIVTTDYVTGATPTAFCVHNVSRKNTGELASAMVALAPDVLIGQKYNHFAKNLKQKDLDILQQYALAKDVRQFNRVLSSDPQASHPFFGFADTFNRTRVDNTLANCTRTALRRLENEQGFFLMIEHSGPDKAGHDNDMSAKLNSVVSFDRAVAVVLEFMKENPDTLLIITSDHETGGVTLPQGNEAPDNKLFTTDEHTGIPVRVFALGVGADSFDGKTVDNTDIAKVIQNTLKK